MALTLVYSTDRSLRSFAGGRTILPILLNLPLTRFLKRAGTKSRDRRKERGQKRRFPIWLKRRKGPAGWRDSNVPNALGSCDDKDLGWKTHPAIAGVLP